MFFRLKETVSLFGLALRLALIKVESLLKARPKDRGEDLYLLSKREIQSTFFSQAISILRANRNYKEKKNAFRKSLGKNYLTIPNGDYDRVFTVFPFMSSNLFFALS